jgi:uncharacterized protein YvpB
MSEPLYRMTLGLNGMITFTPVEPPSNIRLLKVPWVGQNTIRTDDDYSNSDCGAACVAMWLRFRGVEVSVDAVSVATGRQANYPYTTFADLDKAANKYGLDLVHQFGTLTPLLIKDEINAGRPVIALAHYPSLPERYDPNYKASHWVILMGYDEETFFYNDPYWRNAIDGEAIPITGAQLVNALHNVTLNGNTAMQGATRK